MRLARRPAPRASSDGTSSSCVVPLHCRSTPRIPLPEHEPRRRLPWSVNVAEATTTPRVTLVQRRVMDEPVPIFVPRSRLLRGEVLGHPDAMRRAWASFTPWPRLRVLLGLCLFEA